MTSPGTIALTVSYDGAPFAGFARQPGLETVQGRLENALQTALRREVVTVGAGRTDSGVHALGQVVSFDAAGDEPELAALQRSLNALAGPGIVITEMRRMPAGFSARFDALSREYRYRIVPGPIPPVFLAPYCWPVRHTLDLAAMRAAGALLIGERDFKSFCVAASAEGKSTTRALELLSVTPENVLGEHCIEIRLVANAFLHSMVRVIVGSLVEVGSGRRDIAWMGEALEALDRAAAGPTAPPEGLTLWHVNYAEECWL
ncbi:MAG: tRNA pseudouridine(38-40) synthase TruA [Actinobacteria bacterium HGW-Actinobacteria-9]|jgi:tRNA pseudouridine38-40 synthase|nr:MAG: tRNA pseudouridine(38-40) synthase TruA [Actinobacteria bacterium HGW-Actinobacteria-9]